MPRKAKPETTTAAKSAKRKTVKEKKTTTSTKKAAANKVKNLILNAFGFEAKIDESEDVEESETSNKEMDSKNMGNMEISSDTENFGDDTSNGFDDVD